MRTVFCGLSTIDLVQRIDVHPAPNEKITSTSALLDVGGPAANAARTAGILGALPTLISPVGTGIFAKLAHQFLEEAGVVVEDLAETGDPSISSVYVDTQGDRSVVSTNSLGREHTFPGADALAGATALLIDGHLPDVQLALARTAKQSGIPVIFDGGSYKPGTESLLSYVSHAVISEDFTLPGIDPAMTLENLAWKGIDFVAQTRGGKSIEAITQGKAYSLPIQEIAPESIVDTLGAGDVLHGAFVASIGAGEPPLAALSAAAQLATLSVQGEGALGWADHLPHASK